MSAVRLANFGATYTGMYEWSRRWLKRAKECGSEEDLYAKWTRLLPYHPYPENLVALLLLLWDVFDAWWICVVLCPFRGDNPLSDVVTGARLRHSTRTWRYHRILWTELACYGFLRSPFHYSTCSEVLSSRYVCDASIDWQESFSGVYKTRRGINTERTRGRLNASEAYIYTAKFTKEGWGLSLWIVLRERTGLLMQSTCVKSCSISRNFVYVKAHLLRNETKRNGSETGRIEDI